MKKTTEALKMAIESMKGYRRELGFYVGHGANQPCDAEKACKEALEEVKFKPGDKVKSVVYGKGYIDRISDESRYDFPIIVNFDRGDWVSYTPEGRHDTTDPITLFHRVKRGNK